jgi:TctA family transporter
MITNPWVNRISALLLLCVIYAAGYAGGRDQAILARLQQQLTCNTK